MRLNFEFLGDGFDRKPFFVVEDRKFARGTCVIRYVLWYIRGENSVEVSR